MPRKWSKKQREVQSERQKKYWADKVRKFKVGDEVEIMFGGFMSFKKGSKYTVVKATKAGFTIVGDLGPVSFPYVEKDDVFKLVKPAPKKADKPKKVVKPKEQPRLVKVVMKAKELQKVLDNGYAIHTLNVSYTPEIHPVTDMTTGEKIKPDGGKEKRYGCIEQFLLILGLSALVYLLVKWVTMIAVTLALFLAS